MGCAAGGEGLGQLEGPQRRVAGKIHGRHHGNPQGNAGQRQGELCRMAQVEPQRGPATQIHAAVS